MTSPPPSAPLVLIVDDNERNRKLAVDVLRAAGLRTVEAASGGEGIALAAERLPDVILLDLELPDMQGTDVAEGTEPETSLEGCRCRPNAVRSWNRRVVTRAAVPRRPGTAIVSMCCVKPSSGSLAVSGWMSTRIRAKPRCMFWRAGTAARRR